MVDCIGVSDIQRLLADIGPGTFTGRLVQQIEGDFRRWGDFEKSARLASHSAAGVIERMPTSDGQLYAFTYVNGHPRNADAGLLRVTAFDVLADVTGCPLLHINAVGGDCPGRTELHADILRRPDAREVVEFEPLIAR